MTGWHVDGVTLAGYARGRGRLSVDASVEAHLLACGRCRTLLTRAVDGHRLDRLELLWRDVERRVDAPRPGPVERLLRLIGASEGTARLLAATPALRVPWLLAMAATLAFAVLASSVSVGHSGDTLLFLVVAPILPVAGVATAFRRGLDLTYEVALAAPYSQFRLLLLRTATVTVTTCAAAVLAGLFLPGRALTVAAWLLPALALTSLTLVLARRFDVVWAGAGVGALWSVTVLSTHLRVGQFAVFGAKEQFAWLAVAAVSLLVLLAGRDRYAVRLEGV